MNYSIQAAKLLKQLNNNPPLTWEESTTGIRFEATEVEVMQALMDLNKEFQANGVTTLESFLTFLQVHPEEIKETNADKHGWNFECFGGCEAMWIDLDVAYRIEGSLVIFIIDYNRMPCVGCIDCLGYRDECDMHI